jgi:hypothetical protein
MKSSSFKTLFFFIFCIITVCVLHAQTDSSTYTNPFTQTQPSTQGTATTDGNPWDDPGGGVPGGTQDTSVPFDGGLTLLLTIGIAQGVRRSSAQRKKLNAS